MENRVAEKVPTNQKEALLLVLDRIHNSAEIIDHEYVKVSLRAMAEARSLQHAVESQPDDTLAERERCARIAEQWATDHWDDGSATCAECSGARSVAAAIRSGK